MMKQLCETKGMIFIKKHLQTILNHGNNVNISIQIPIVMESY